MDHVAHVDESSHRLGSSQLYALTAVITESNREDELCEALRGLLGPGDDVLRHYDMDASRQRAAALALARLEMMGAIVVCRSTPPKDQERTRAKLLSWLPPQLEHVHSVRQVWIESRYKSDKHDLRTRDRLRKSHRITTAMRVDTRPKAEDPRLWIADFIVGSYGAAICRNETKCWDVLTDAHAIEVREH